ncbi:MAG TPA: GNAT family N-acetyltransferase [Gammaproteobacteria bacterium]|nr:GNAT family N-acetyltransferase [Gammaproteobacteria bacterium]
MKSDRTKVVKDNLSAFWSKCFSTNSTFEVINKQKIFHTVSDIDDPLMNAVTSSNYNDNEIANAVEEITSLYNNKKLSFCWWVDTEQDHPQLSKTLQQNKFTLFGDVSGMYMKLESVPESQASTSREKESKSEVEIQQVTTEDELKDWIKPIQTSFGMSDLSTQKYLEIFQKLSQTQNPPIHFIAKHQGKIVGSSTLFCDKVAGIYNCATLPEYRGKGILSALTTTMLAKAKELGFTEATLQASPMSVRVFRKHGFEDVVPYQVYLKPR